MAFWATIMLEVSFPTHIPLSKEGQLASAYLMKATSHCEAIAQDLKTCDLTIPCITLQPGAYLWNELAGKCLAEEGRPV
jgi:hypothetical protein